MFRMLLCSCCVAIVIQLIACSDTSQPGYNDSAEKQSMLRDQRELYDTNFKKWESANILNYEFTRAVDCQCNDKRDMVVNVVDGAIDSAYYVNGQGKVNEGVVDPEHSQYASIGALFKLVDSAIKHHYDNVDVSYDKDYGYPAVIQLLPNNSEKQNFLRFQVNNFNVRFTISFPSPQPAKP